MLRGPVEPSPISVDPVDDSTAVAGESPSSLISERSFERLIRDYAGTYAMRAAIAEAFARGLHDGDEALVEALLAVIEQVEDRELVTLAVDVFAADWMHPDDAKPSRRHWRICLASAETLARILGPSGNGLLVDGMERHPASRPLHLLVAEQLLWTHAGELAAGLGRFDAHLDGAPWVRALVRLALAIPNRSFDAESFGHLVSAASPEPMIKRRVIRAAILALDASQAVDLLRSVADAPNQGEVINFIDAMAAVESLRSSAAGEQSVAGLLDAALAGLDGVESRRQSEMLALVAFIASGAGPASERSAARVRLRDYLRRTSAASASHDQTGRGNLMLVAGADLSTAELFDWADRALADADYGVLTSCLSRFETSIEVDGAFASGAQRDQLARLLRRVFDLPANDATESCRFRAAEVARKGRFEQFATSEKGD